MTSTIDFVLPWLNSSDSGWQSLYQQYSTGEEGDIEARFRDWGWLRYWFRSVERYAPWVHRIFVITNCQPPHWLNLDHPKLVWVDHREFIPQEYLPTFNANTIELNLHHIPGLSEHFVYFNDDLLLNAPIQPTYYFRDGLPVDATAEALFFGSRYDFHNWGTKIIEFCNLGIINSHFCRREVVQGNRRRWYGSYLPWRFRVKAFILSFQSQFLNFYTPHHERPLLKSVFSEVWDAEPAFLSQSCSRFRQNESANVYLMRLWHLVTNRFYPDRCRLSGHYYEILPDTLDDICNEIMSGNTPSVCFNDVPQCSHEFYLIARERIQAALEVKFPHTCSFELP